MTTARPRQFSLRLLMLVVLGCCLLLGAWRLLGEVMPIALAFAAVFALPLWLMPGTWLRAWLVSTLAAYGPFGAMATYTLLFVSCSHCKGAAFTLSPFGPGLIAVEIGRNVLDLPRPPEWVVFAMALVVGAALVAALAWLLRTCRWWWSAPCLAMTLVYCTWGAAAMLAVIRA